MFWLHGGRFSTGSGSNNAYNGVRLAKRGDVVVITVNHRLNLFGHLYLAEFGADFADSGNASILDLILALEWVRDNAASFGGDPGNVTIFGESGGAAKVSVLMAMSAAQGLFHRTIVQSGPLLQVIPAEQAAEATRAVVAKLGLTAATADRLRTMPAADIQAAAREVAAAGASVNLMGQLGGIAGGPVLDGRNVKHHPFHPQAAPEGRSVPMLIGVNRTETSLLIGAARPALFDLTFDNLPAALAPQFPEFDIEAIIAGYRKLHPACNPAAVFFAITSDRSFLRLSIALADRKADQGGAPTYFYLLDWDTPVDGGKWLCPHALDIPFVFDNVATSASMCGIGAEQQRLADIMSETWLAFARAGDPNNELVPEWPAYDARRRPVMVFDLPPYLIDDPRAAERALFSPATQRVPA
jgi:para-nitrobenzyl esterase